MFCDKYIKYINKIYFFLKYNQKLLIVLISAKKNLDSNKNYA